MTIIFLFQTKIHVVVNFFLSHVIFVFLLLLGMVMYDNDVETKEKYKLPEIKKITTTYMCLKRADCNDVELLLFEIQSVPVLKS